MNILNKLIMDASESLHQLHIYSRGALEVSDEMTRDFEKLFVDFYEKYEKPSGGNKWTTKRKN